MYISRTNTGHHNSLLSVDDCISKRLATALRGSLQMLPAFIDKKITGWAFDLWTTGKKHSPRKGSRPLDPKLCRERASFQAWIWNTFKVVIAEIQMVTDHTLTRRFFMNPTWMNHVGRLAL